jgi:preprotein translocase subunit SecF
MMLDIIGKRYLFFLISGVIILVCIISLATAGLKPGIELSSGSMLTLNFEQTVKKNELEQELADSGHENATVQEGTGGAFVIRTAQLTDEEKAALNEELTAEFGPFEERGFETIDPVIARQTSRTAGIAVAVAAMGILLYLTWAFRRMPNPFRYGTCAIIALVHDALVALGIFSILGALLGWEINLMFIMGILAVIGYSVNNTVVVFDRIRENLARSLGADFQVVVNNSLVETLGRSLNTSLTTLIVVLALLFFVGASIQNFAVVLLIGIIIGTFSSICVAPSLLVVWEKGEWGRLLQWLPPVVARTKRR